MITKAFLCVDELQMKHYLFITNGLLDGDTPRDLIQRGEMRRVLELIATVEEGIHT